MTEIETRTVEQTLLTLRHTGIPAEHAEAHRSGWAHFLAALVEAAGVDESPGATAPTATTPMITEEAS